MNQNEMAGIIVSLTTNDLNKCTSFWDIPENIDSYRLTELMRSGKRKAFAYQIGNDYVGGCALSVREEDCGHFSFFAVAPDFRRKGIGSKMIDFAVNYFKDIGMKRIRLHVFKNNPDAIRLYERKGFVYAFDVTSEKIAMIKTI